MLFLKADTTGHFRFKGAKLHSSPAQPERDLMPPQAALGLVLAGGERKFFPAARLSGGDSALMANEMYLDADTAAHRAQVIADRLSRQFAAGR